MSQSLFLCDDEIEEHMKEWTYMSKWPDITHSMRAILMDWLVEVDEEYKLQTEILFISVSY